MLEIPRISGQTRGIRVFFIATEANVSVEQQNEAWGTNLNFSQLGTQMSPNSDPW
jgi:hypothetical protein